MSTIPTAAQALQAFASEHEERDFHTYLDRVQEEGGRVPPRLVHMDAKAAAKTARENGLCALFGDNMFYLCHNQQHAVPQDTAEVHFGGYNAENDVQKKIQQLRIPEDIFSLNLGNGCFSRQSLNTGLRLIPLEKLHYLDLGTNQIGHNLTHSQLQEVFDRSQNLLVLRLGKNVLSTGYSCKVTDTDNRIRFPRTLVELDLGRNNIGVFSDHMQALDLPPNLTTLHITNTAISFHRNPEDGGFSSGHAEANLLNLAQRNCLKLSNLHVSGEIDRTILFNALKRAYENTINDQTGTTPSIFNLTNIIAHISGEPTGPRVEEIPIPDEIKTLQQQARTHWEQAHPSPETDGPQKQLGA